jgi:hypothetical protein
VTTRRWNSTDVDVPVTVLPYLKMLKMQFEVGNLAARIDPFFTPLSLPSLEFLELGFAPSSQLV